jgi:hypothetical protein
MPDAHFESYVQLDEPRSHNTVFSIQYPTTSIRLSLADYPLRSTHTRPSCQYTAAAFQD